ncbi:MAG: substrate-binding domain-containing protein [Planctomycetia bacterium]|nr:substrate-binding domain-containing protein [Planctomycetia bacterium]
MRKKSSIPRVSIILSLSINAGRMRFGGIVDYARLYGPWSLNYHVGGSEELQLPEHPISDTDGIIARVVSEETWQRLKQQLCPVVLMDPELPPEEFPEILDYPTVMLDNEATGRMAANYFLECHYHHFAVVMPENEPQWAIRRRRGFEAGIRTLNAECFHYHTSSHFTQETPQTRQKLVRWLKKLPKPIAIMGTSDVEGRKVVDACLKANLAVPYEVAVMGVGDDEYVCNSCFPPLTSINIQWRQCGMLAAETLDHFFKQKPISTTRYYYPLSITVRGSTTKQQVTDRLMMKILEEIQFRDGVGLTVSGLAKKYRLSRQWLEKRFRQVVGSPLKQEISNRRLKKIAMLVAESDLSFNEICKRVELENKSYLRNLFKKEFGMTMQEYRRRKQRGKH